ncbi:helix-turn-helix domain-containing protein [Streptomyces purpureus]|uniref:helix-turn-helix domain-containing protein n=1 Tax=Streptomyces purpureus TaxID=1951 RepID=UPI0037BC323F
MGLRSEGLAGLLRELKERSGRSYGALAQQLHVSTSTLHRYCNGDAVPTEFAPVEKLARLCGADRDELLRLHRAWIVADEDRRRARSAPPAAPQETPGARPETPEEARPKAPADEAEPASRAAVPEPAGQDAVTEPAAAADPEPVPEPLPEPEAEAPATSDPAAQPRPEAPEGARRRRLGPLAAAAGLVLLAASGAAVALTGDPSRAAAPVPSRSTGSSAAPFPGTGTAGGGDAGDARATPSSSPPASPSAGNGGGPATRPIPGDGTQAAPDEPERPPTVPFTADVDPYVWKDPCSQTYVLDRQPDQVPWPPSPQGARGWVTPLKGVPGDEVVIDVSLQGTGEETVLLKALHVHTVGTSEPLAGNAYVMGVGCGGEARLQSLDINLDAAQPRPVPVAGYRGDRFVPASDFPYKVSADDPQVVRITAHTRARSVRWYLELEWSSGGRSGTLRLDDKGRPFTTTATTGLPKYQFPLGANAWEPYQAG